jgi:acetate kinase
MTEAILVINAGSSSVKFAGFAARGDEEPLFLGKGELEGIGSDPYFAVKNKQGEKVGEYDWPRGSPLGHADAIRYIIDWIKSNAGDVRLLAAGHRVVFGGEAYTGPVRLDAAIIAGIEKLVPFFPLHLPHNLAAINAVAETYPELPQVACFDNAFHRTWPRLAQLFAIPRAMTDDGIRRYGFRGLSYEYIARRLPDFVPGASRVVVAHLGSGASMCAIHDGESIEGTLGFSGLDGLPMGTRSGQIDPGVLLYWMQALHMDAKRVERLLYKDSGLLGVSGISNDMRDLLASTDPHAMEAVELFCYHVAKQLGTLAATLGGLDALVFTAGIGEHAAPVRERVCRRAEWLGIHLDEAANAAGGPRITTEASPVSAWVIPTDEEKMIAIHTRNVLASGERAL